MCFWQILAWLAAIMVSGLISTSVIRVVYNKHLEAECQTQAQATFDYVRSEFSKVYFCSYRLWEVYFNDFFLRFRKFVDWGFCSSTAAMSMIALKSNPTARIVYARASEGNFIHAWVEFHYRRQDYVIDPAWCFPFIVIKQAYYDDNRPRILKIIDHEEFWSYPISGQFLKKMSHPVTSWLLWELMFFYGFDISKNPIQFFHPDLANQTLREDDGKHIALELWYNYPQVLFSRRIFHEMMQHPKAKSPKAHTVRKLKRAQKIVKSSYEDWLRENYPEEYANQTQPTPT